MKELILGGQKSGKSRTAEARAQAWLTAAGHEAVLLATATAADAEMAQRIARHRADRAARTPALQTVEESQDIAGALRAWSRPHRIVVIDCLTLWLTQLAMPIEGAPASSQVLRVAIEALFDASAAAPGPMVYVSNEIGLGVAPLSSEARQFIDSLGLLHQTIGSTCERVTLMVAGCELTIRSAAT